MDEFRIITKLGGEAAVYAQLKEAGVVTTRRAMNHWRTRRGRISGAAMYELMRLAEANGIAYELKDFELSAPRAGNGSDDTVER